MRHNADNRIQKLHTLRSVECMLQEIDHVVLRMHAILPVIVQVLQYPDVIQVLVVVEEHRLDDERPVHHHLSGILPLEEAKLYDQSLSLHCEVLQERPERPLPCAKGDARVARCHMQAAL